MKFTWGRLRRCNETRYDRFMRDVYARGRRGGYPDREWLRGLAVPVLRPRSLWAQIVLRLRLGVWIARRP